MPFESFGDVFRAFLGLQRPQQEFPRDEHWGTGGWDDRDDRDDVHHNSNDVEDMFDIFSESLQMHKYFEKQFGDIMRIFNSSIFDGHPPIDDSGSFSEKFQPVPERSLRDEYLKPGYQKNTSPGGMNSKDSDLDGIIAPGDLDRLMKSEKNSLIPYEKNKSVEPFSNNNPNFFSYVITRTTTKPDGSIEIRKTVRDSKTNKEETTVTVIEKDDPQNPTTYNPSDDFNWNKFFKH